MPIFSAPVSLLRNRYHTAYTKYQSNKIKSACRMFFFSKISVIRSNLDRDKTIDFIQQVYSVWIAFNVLLIFEFIHFLFIFA